MKSGTSLVSPNQLSEERPEKYLHLV